MCCKLHSEEFIAAYIEKFAVPAFCYLILTKSAYWFWRDSGIAIVLLLNTNLMSQTLTSFISNLMISAKRLTDNHSEVIQMS